MTSAGPTPRLKPLGSDWQVADTWRLSAAGAVARAGPEALRVSELFEVRRGDEEKTL